MIAMTCYATRCYEPIPGFGYLVLGAMAVGALIGLAVFFWPRR
jgi:hypothetical protein